VASKTEDGSSAATEILAFEITAGSVPAINCP